MLSYLRVSAIKMHMQVKESMDSTFRPAQFSTKLISLTSRLSGTPRSRESFDLRSNLDTYSYGISKLPNIIYAVQSESNRVNLFGQSLTRHAKTRGEERSKVAWGQLYAGS